MNNATAPLLYEVYGHVWCHEWTQKKGQETTLATIPEEELERLARLGFNWIWVMGVWQTGKRGLHLARTHPNLVQTYRTLLGDYYPHDVVGSPYAISDYTVHTDLGGPEALAELRDKLKNHGLKLMLDFVPNHTAIDHEWVYQYPEYYIQANEQEAIHNQAFHCDTSQGPSILYHGKDPYFPGWTDTAQLNWANPDTLQRMSSTLLSIADQCDGVRCDMAMLLLREIFQKTWKLSAPKNHEEYWLTVIKDTRYKYPDFKLLAEVYWGLEEQLNNIGFNWTYDKELYDRLKSFHVSSISDHLHMPLQYRKKRMHFLENHDEERAAASYSTKQHQAAAFIMMCLPGGKLIHHKQMEGYKFKTPVQLGRFPSEPTDMKLLMFYEKLFSLVSKLDLQYDQWHMATPSPAWEGNNSHTNMLVFTWSPTKTELAHHIAIVNYSSQRSQCNLKLLGIPDNISQITFHDLLDGSLYPRPTETLAKEGLYIELEPFKMHLLEVTLD